MYSTGNIKYDEEMNIRKKEKSRWKNGKRVKSMYGTI